MIRLCLLLSLFLATNVAFSKDKEKASYSLAVNAGDFIYVSGQVPIDPSTGTMIEGDIETLTNQAIDNVKHILKMNGADLKHVVSTVVYLADIRDYDAMNEVYKQRFHFKYPPARDVVAVSDLLYNARIEISCIAYKKRH
jgi:2-iminobutanoate/2-iminopropanoate deaminase